MVVLDQANIRKICRSGPTTICFKRFLLFASEKAKSCGKIALLIRATLLDLDENVLVSGYLIVLGGVALEHLRRECP